MKPYELMVIVDPDIGGDATKKYLDELRKLIADQKGEIFFEDMWGMRDMAYPIKKRDKGFYAVMDFNGMPESMKEIDATLRLDNEVLRHMIVALPKGYEAKSFLITEEEEKAEAEEKKAKVTRSAAPKVAPKKEEAKVKVKEEAEAVGEEPKKKPAAKKKVEAKPEEPSLEEVDAKLRSIIDNPDINF